MIDGGQRASERWLLTDPAFIEGCREAAEDARDEGREAMLEAVAERIGWRLDDAECEVPSNLRALAGAWCPPFDRSVFDVPALAAKILAALDTAE